MADLFGQTLRPAAREARTAETPRPARSARAADGERVVSVAVAANLWRAFDYRWPQELGPPCAGLRVYVPFGRGDRRQLAFVLDAAREDPGRPLKAVAERLDAEPLLEGGLWELARWISRYYLTPLGLVAAAMIPSAVGRSRPRTEAVARLLVERELWPARLGSRQKRILDELLEARSQGVEPLTVEKLLDASGAARESLNRLAERELIELRRRRVQAAQLRDEVGEDPVELNEDQQEVLGRLLERIGGGGFGVSLLHGVTGSGKTEVYIRAIREVVRAGGQAILLVPEIALATQTLQRILGRLPRVAVMHSGLTDAQRADSYRLIRSGEARVVVGPRSAVFAPTRDLRLIVVDEEHESSYKQDTAPPYHARDVAVLRASMCGAAVVLGSATPSMESLANARAGRYELLKLPRRVRSLPMPALEVVPLRSEMSAGRIELLGRTLTLRLAGVLQRGEQAILLMNRRGFASYVFCPASGWILTCEDCDRPLVYHRATELAICHHCQQSRAVPPACPISGGKLVYFGYGIQRVEQELRRKFPEARLARMDSDTMTSPQQFRELFDRFSAGELDLLLGTQMVGKGLDFPRVSLVGVVSADTALSIPDFRASERTFQLIVQVAGRAGRSDLPGEVIVQTLYPEEPAVELATRHDYEGFAAVELPAREQMALPPATRLVRLLVRHAESQRAEAAAGQLADRLRALLPEEVELTGPMPCGVIRLRNLFRFQVLLSCRRAGRIQQVLQPHMDALVRELPAELLADADPVQLI